MLLLIPSSLLSRTEAVIIYVTRIGATCDDAMMIVSKVGASQDQTAASSIECGQKDDDDDGCVLDGLTCKKCYGSYSYLGAWPY